MGSALGGLPPTEHVEGLLSGTRILDILARVEHAVCKVLRDAIVNRLQTVINDVSLVNGHEVTLRRIASRVTEEGEKVLKACWTSRQDLKDKGKIKTVFQVGLQSEKPRTAKRQKVTQTDLSMIFKQLNHKEQSIKNNATKQNNKKYVPVNMISCWGTTA